MIINRAMLVLPTWLTWLLGQLKPKSLIILIISIDRQHCCLHGSRLQPLISRVHQNVLQNPFTKSKDPKQNKNAKKKKNLGRIKAIGNAEKCWHLKVSIQTNKQKKLKTILFNRFFMIHRLQLNIMPLKGKRNRSWVHNFQVISSQH